MRINSEQCEIQVKELLDSVEKALNCLEECNHKASAMRESLIGIPAKYRMPIEQCTFLERSREELIRVHGFLTETACYLETMNQMQVIYGPPPAFEKLEL